jgi:amino acid transporter
MENIETNFDNNNPEMPVEGGLQITQDIEQDWIKTSKWVMFFAVLGFIVFGIYSLFAVFGGLMLGAFAESEAFPMAGALGLFFFVIIAAVLAFMFFMNLYQLRFANNIGRAVNFSDDVALERAWLNMRNYFRLLGIMTIVFIVIYALIIIGLGATGMAAAFENLNGM